MYTALRIAPRKIAAERDSRSNSNGIFQNAEQMPQKEDI